MMSTMRRLNPKMRLGRRSIRAEEAPTVELSAVIVACVGDLPQVLTVRDGRSARDALPSGPLEPEHRTLEAGLRSWVERRAGRSMGYMEQLYTFGDLDRAAGDGSAQGRSLSVAYLALVREPNALAGEEPAWKTWYDYLPWEDWRRGRPPALTAIEERLRQWSGTARTVEDRRAREKRTHGAFGFRGAPWSEERVLERYELLYEARLVVEAAGELSRDRPTGTPMEMDHRRILATAVGRLRGKIKYRPVVFELMPPVFTLLQLQRAVEALSGMRIHKQNFRRLVMQQGLVEETGQSAADTGGRPAKLVRFRPEVLLERLAPGVRTGTVRPAAP